MTASADMPLREGLSRYGSLPAWLIGVGDSATISTALTREVPEFASGRLDLRGCEVARVRAKRDSHGAVYLITAREASGSERVVELNGDVLAPGAPEPDASRNDGAVPFGADGWRMYLPDLRLDLRVQPSEPTLPAVPVLTDPEQARELLERAIRAWEAYADLRIEAVHLRVVRVKGSRCTVLYDLEFAPGGDGPTPIVAKAYRGDKGENAYAGMRALWDSKLGTSGVVTVAQPLDFVPELKVLVQGPVPGQTTLKSLIKTAFETGTAEALLEVSVYVDKAAIGLAELHTSGVRYGRTTTFADKVADIRETADRVGDLEPELAGAGEPLLTRLEEEASKHQADEAVPTHGSFRPNQVLLNEGEIGFIDFDRVGQAEPALDVASFRVAMRDAGRLDTGSEGAAAGASRERIAQLDGLCDRFLERYAEAAPVSRERVRVWEVLGLFTNVLYCWTKMETGLETRLELLVSYLQASGLG